MLQLLHDLSFQLFGKYHCEKSFSSPRDSLPDVISASQEAGGRQRWLPGLSLGIQAADMTLDALPCGYVVLHTCFAGWCWLLFPLQREILYNPLSYFWLCDRKIFKMPFALPGDKQNLPPNVDWTGSACSCSAQRR